MNVSTGQHDGYYNPATGEIAQTGGGGSVDLTAVNNSITQLTNNNIATALSIQGINTNITQLQTDVGNNNTDITQLQTDVNNNDADIGYLGQSISVNQAGIGTNLGLISNKANTSDVVSLTGNQTITGENTFTNNINVFQQGILIGGSGSNVDGHISLYCSAGTHHTKIKTHPHAAGATTYQLVLPAALPTAVGQVLSSDLNGNLSWTNKSTSGGGSGLSSIILNSAVSLTVGTASSNVQFRVNEAPLGQITLTPQATNLTFNPASIALSDANQTSANFTITANSGAGTTPTISVAITNPAANTQTTPITVDQTYGPAITIAAAAAVTNHPWTSGTPNGWTQIRNLPHTPGAAVWYNGNLISYNSGVVYSDGPTPPLNVTPANNVEWGKSWSTVPNWTQLCFQTIDAGGTGANNGYPSAWIIYDKSVIDGLSHNSGSPIFHNNVHTVAGHNSSVTVLTSWRWHSGNYTPEVYIGGTNGAGTGIYFDNNIDLSAYHSGMMQSSYQMGVFIR